MGCLDDRVIYDFASGGLEAELLASVDDHIDSCESCRMAVVALVRSAPPPAESAIGFEETALGQGHAPLPLSSSAESKAHPTSTLEQGQLINDKYLVLDVLGAGAMGVVYSAWDTGLERKVAIKTLRADASWKNRKERFVREAQAMAKVAHPNVVAVHEVGEVGELAFIAMEFVEGKTLQQWAAGNKSWQELRDMCVQAGRGLMAAHEAGLVHRDYKPGNVIVGADGRARVTDFGLVALGQGQVVDEESMAEAPLDLTVTGAVMGTPAYMAPEQFKAEAVDARTDQYAFCVATWEALTGSRPIAKASFEEQLEAVLAGVRPEPPAKLPRWVVEALLKGMAVAPGERHASMAELLDALEKDKRRSPGKWLAGGVAVAGLGVAVAILATKGPTVTVTSQSMCTGAADEMAELWNPERAQSLASKLPGQSLDGALDAWSLEWADAHTATCKATREEGSQSEELLDARMLCLAQRKGEMDALLSEAEKGALTVPFETSMAELPAIERCSNIEVLAEAKPAPESARIAQQSLAEGRALAALGKYREASEMLERLAKHKEVVAFEPLRAEVELLRGQALWRLGELGTSKEASLSALAHSEASRADYVSAEAWLTLLGLAVETGIYDVAVERARLAEAAIRRVGEPDELRARYLHSEGVLLYNLGKEDEALRSLNAALELRSTLYGAEHSLVASTHTSLGNLYRVRGDLGKALDHHQRAMAIDRKIVGDEHPVMGRHEHNVAGILRLQGKMDEAEGHYQKALAIKSKELGAESVEVALTQNSLGLIALGRGNLDGAEELFTKAEAVLSAAKHADAAVSAQNLGLVYRGRGELGQAMIRFRRALALYPQGSPRRSELEKLMEETKVELRAMWREGQTKRPLDPFGSIPGASYAPSQSWD